jgi:GNAT superfamily N-acetyltransferase
MGLVERVKRRVVSIKPEIGSVFITYIPVPPLAGRPLVMAEGYDVRFVESADDPAIDELPRWQRPLARRHLADRTWAYLLVTESATGLKVGHVWVALESPKGIANGMLNVRLAPGEAYIYDLFIHPDHRRAALGNAMGQMLVDTFADRGVEWGLTQVVFDNMPSVMWHHMFGFNWMQLGNYLRFGDRYWFKIPLSESPRFGPLSKRGRHSEPDPGPPFGGSFLPQDVG